MSLDVCLPDLERKGVLDVGRSKEARELYEQLRKTYERAHDPATAAAMASQQTIVRLEAAIAHKKRNTVRQIKAQQNALHLARQFNGGDPAGTGPIDPKAIEAILAFDQRAGHNDTVFARANVIRGRAHSMVADVLKRFKANIAGSIRNRAELEDVVRELFKPGSSLNDNARELAAAWSKASEYLRARFNEAGGQIAKLDNWGLPQSHSSVRVREAGFDAWRNDIVPLLDRGKMIDFATGEPMTDAALELRLRETWERIRTDGWSTITPGANGGKMLANQHAEHRFLQFTDGDAWLAYQAKYGDGTAFHAMMAHIDTMARDIALMEVLGPNPSASIKYLQDQVLKTANMDGSPGSEAIDRAEAGVPKIERLYKEITGELRRPESRKLALGFGAFRSLQTAAKLGSAILSALPTDPAFGAITRAYNGLPVTKMLAGYIKQLASSGDRMAAVRRGLIAEEWAHITAGQHRMLNEELTGEFASRLASGVLRVTGLAAYTQAGRWAFGMEALAHLTEQAAKRFDELDPALRGAMERHGITAADWDAIRSSPRATHKGSDWIDPMQVTDQRAGDRLLQWIQTETDYAVPVADARTRAVLNSNAKRGTWTGELIKTAMLFKTFGVSVILLHGRRMLQTQNLGTKAAYAVAFAGLTTIGGAMAMQIKEIAKGKDPRPMDGDGDPKLAAEFWGAAMLQGGGFGIFGDFLGSQTNRVGGGIASTIAGPAAQTFDNTGRLIYSSGRALAGDRKANPGRDLVKLIKQETPGSSMWQTRLAFERLLLDQLQEEIDPNYRRSWRQIERTAEERGQEFWWEPGETSPDRAPE